MISFTSSHHQAVDNFSFISETPLDLCAILSEAHHPEAGAVVLFSGEVRNHSHGKSVSYLDYEAFAPMANKIIAEIIGDANEKWKLNIALCKHRIGKVNICETAVIVITASAHRVEAYEANQYIIDRVKHEAPIWKKEFFSDGSYEWSHNCGCFNLG